MFSSERKTRFLVVGLCFKVPGFTNNNGQPYMILPPTHCLAPGEKPRNKNYPLIVNEPIAMEKKTLFPWFVCFPKHEVDLQAGATLDGSEIRLTSWYGESTIQVMQDFWTINSMGWIYKLELLLMEERNPAITSWYGETTIQVASRISEPSTVC